MSDSNKSFEPRLMIANHFDDIINQIDIKTETLLENKIYPEETRKELNEIRAKQIEKIKELKEINLNLLKNNENKETKKLDLEKLIHFDCVLVEQPKSLNDLVLWITSWFYNKDNLEFLK